MSGRFRYDVFLERRIGQCRVCSRVTVTEFSSRVPERIDLPDKSRVLGETTQWVGCWVILGGDGVPNRKVAYIQFVGVTRSRGSIFVKVEEPGRIVRRVTYVNGHTFSSV